MGKFLKVLKDRKIRKNFSMNELNFTRMKYYLNSYDKNIKMFVFMKFLFRFNLNFSYSRIVNRCVISGHSRWIIRRFKLTRMTFKNLADYGKLNGVGRGSW